MALSRQLDRTKWQLEWSGSMPAGTLALVLLCATATTSAEAQDVRRGELLYENHCGDCHDRNVHQRDKHEIGTVNDVRAWVASWSAHQELGWSEEEVDDVTLYLARNIYRFDR